ncbi:hypothetical protein SOVF_059160, partial [Spinacia oleracea]
MQFELEDGTVGKIFGDQQVGRRCYVNSLKRVPDTPQPPTKKVKQEETPLVLFTDCPLGYDRPKPAEADKEEVLQEGTNRMVRVGTGIEEALRNKILSVLREFQDVFAYTVEEMPGIDPSILTHHLHIKPEYKPVEQKLRHQGVERNAADAAEVKKLLEAGFIKECQYSEWLENVVLVKKPTGAWRMCVDFTDLNKACPKDDHPLPKIDRLVDSIAGHALFSFMDANAGYH